MPDLQHTSHLQREGLVVTCPLAPDALRLISGFCSSPRDFALDFLRAPPRDDALVLRLCDCQDLHPTSFVPCTAHTLESGIACGNSPHDTGDQAPIIPAELQATAISKKIFSMRRLQPSGAGLVQQTVQIVASHDLTLFVRPCPCFVALPALIHLRALGF